MSEISSDASQIKELKNKLLKAEDRIGVLCDCIREFLSIESLVSSTHWRAKAVIKSAKVVLGKPVGETHNMAAKRHPYYETWKAMKYRCLNKRHKDYVLYGARNVGVCDRWVESFWDFVKDMGPKPTPEHTLDRIDPYKGYSPENCRWATSLEQARNKRIPNKALFSGVTFHKQCGKWQAMALKAHTGKPKKYIGLYKTEHEAVEAVKKYLGEP